MYKKVNRVNISSLNNDRRSLEITRSNLEVKLRNFKRYRNIYTGSNYENGMVLFFVVATLTCVLILIWETQQIGSIIISLILFITSYLVVSVEISILRTHNQLDMVNTKITLAEKINDFLDAEPLENTLDIKAQDEIQNTESPSDLKINHKGSGVKDEGAYFNKLVAINIENLASYYSLVKVHTDNSFYLNVSAGIIGFILIVTGIIIGLVNESKDIISYIAFASGIITEFITGIFFILVVYVNSRVIMIAF